MYPATVLWYPTIADSLLQYRMQRVLAAKEHASEAGFSGAKFPWQSAYSGAEQTPSGCDDGTYEIHITGDIAFAAQQYWYATRNETWLREAYPGLLKETADFWLSRVSWDGNVAHIKDVTAPDEYARHIDDSVYTNYVAQRNLIFAIEAANFIGQEPNPDWQKTADAIPILFDDAQKRHPEYSGYNGGKIKQGDVVLLGFPLMMNMTEEVRRSDLEYYTGVTDGNGPAMTWAMHAIGYLELGDQAQADSNFDRAFANAQPPFGVWSETPTGGAVNFITGAGGFLQAVLFGLPGLRIWPAHLALRPSFVSSMESVTVRGIHYRGAVFTLSYDAHSMTLTAARGSATLVFEDAQGSASLAAGESLQRPTGPATITVDALSMTLV
jgi:trehalose/maltose hydrolase-like predicted phosphorylase